MVKISEEFKEKYEKIIFDEVKYGIFTALELYKSLNLKKLAQLVGRPETTTIRYIKLLLSDGLIDIDAAKTAISWGKFYCLSKEAKILADEVAKQRLEREKQTLAQVMKLRGKSEEEIQRMYVKDLLSKKNLETLGEIVKSQLAFKHNVENFTANELYSSLEKFQELLSNKGRDYLEENLVLEPTEIVSTSCSVPLTKGSHVLRIYEINLRLQSDLMKLKEELEKEMDEENVPEEKRTIMNLHFFFGTMDFRFSLKDEK